MKRFKLSLVAAAIAASATLAACGSDAPSNTAANTSNTSNASNADANAAARATPAAPAADAPGADEFASARADYKNLCIKCHKEDGSGGSVELEDGQKIKVPNFRAEKHTEEQFVRKISNGDPDEGMPAFKNRLDPARIAALARLILHEFPAGPAGGSNAAKPATPAH
jgi:mono/diheme cytochrome c family protein